MPAQLASAVREYRYVFAVARLECSVGIDIHDREAEMKTGLLRMQARDHLIAEMAIGTAVDSECRRPGVSSHWP